MLSSQLCLLYLTVVSFFDLLQGRIPNCATLGFFAAAILTDSLSAPSKIPARLLCSLFFFASFCTAASMTNGLGFGDAKMAAVLGYSAGFYKASLSLILACAAGLMFFIAANSAKRTVKKIPFAPFVAVGYAATELFCRRIL